MLATNRCKGGIKIIRQPFILFQVRLLGLLMELDTRSYQHPNPGHIKNALGRWSCHISLGQILVVGTDREAVPEPELEGSCSSCDSHYPYSTRHFETSIHILPCVLCSNRLVSVRPQRGNFTSLAWLTCASGSASGSALSALWQHGWCASESGSHHAAPDCNWKQPEVGAAGSLGALPCHNPRDFLDNLRATASGT